MAQAAKLPMGKSLICSISFNRTEVQSVLSDNEIEMLADMHVVQGLANLRLMNIKRAGRCFDDAKAFKVPRKSQMLILVQSTNSTF